MIANAESLHAQHVLDVVRGKAAPVGQGDASIARSWRRCFEDHALDPATHGDPCVLEAHRLAERRAALERLRDVSTRALQRLQRHLRNASQAVLLTDADGVILDCLAHDSQQVAFNQAGLWPGADWSEGREGTNGIGTCVVEGQPVIIYRDEHFRSRHTPLTCTASPVFDPQGQLLAVLDVSSASTHLTRQSQFHTLALTNVSAKAIEAGYFLREHAMHWILNLQDGANGFGGLAQGLIALDGDGTVLAADQGALHLLGYERPRVCGASIGAFCDIALDALFARAQSQPAAGWPLRFHTGETLHAWLRQPFTHKAERTVMPIRQGSSTAPVFADKRLEDALRRACRVHANDIPVVLSGETGVGKDVFAKAVHAASERASKPFVAVNCAAIPETLIESELFGYRAGSFTGARKEGMTGKLAEAHGGTLFLDEIGDMPAAMQTRLLRVLEERQVVPLGGGVPQAVDIRLISASHRDLDQLVAEGTFREDLFYRIGGLRIDLPPLRARTDKQDLLHAVLQQEAHGRAFTIEPAAERALLDYGWPGNVRQLRTVVRTLVALCDDATLRWSDLPESIRLTSRIANADGLAESPLALSERGALERELERHAWQVSQTAAALGVSRNTLYRKMRRHGIARPERDPA